MSLTFLNFFNYICSMRCLFNTHFLGIPIESEKIWEKSYDGTTDCGGIITVRSELGEPIHKVATRGMRLWREFDRRFFAIPRNDRPAVIFAAKDEIIQRVNADFQKLYFGIQTSSDGATTVPCEVNEMTYYGVLARMGALMFVDSETR